MTLVWQGLTERPKATSGHQQNSTNNILLQDKEKMLLITTVKQLYSSFIYPMRSLSRRCQKHVSFYVTLKLGDQKHKADKMSLITALRLGGVHKDILLIL